MAARLPVVLLVPMCFAVLTSIPAATADEAATGDGSAAVTQDELKGHLEGLEELLQTMQGDLDKLKRFKFSGYVQARYEIGETSSDTVRTSGSPYAVTVANVSRFFIRRARLKLTYDSSPLSQAVLYVDGGQDRTVRLLEAYVTLLDPWTPLHDHRLTAGQFNVPFGWELERSSSARELPERSRAENVLFPGERDRGVKIESAWTPRFSTTFAVLNGAGVSSADFPATDPTRGKDAVARGRFSFGVADIACSWYAGRHVVPLTGGDVNTEKSRLGVDVQAYYQVPAVGGGSLRAEWYAGHEVNPDSVRLLVVAPTSANPVRVLRAGADPAHLATDASGGYLMWVQNLGERFQLAARWDAYDPNSNADHDAYQRLGAGLNWYYDGYTRVTLAYDAPTTDVANGAGGHRDPHDNLWTFQLQHKF